MPQKKQKKQKKTLTKKTKLKSSINVKINIDNSKKLQQEEHHQKQPICNHLQIFHHINQQEFNNLNQ